MQVPYNFNEASLVLPDAYGLVDRSRQFLQVETSNGTKLTLIVARAPADDQSLQSFMEKGLTEHRRSLRGFNLLSCTERRYPDLVGIEVRFQFVEKGEGPVFHHEFHCVLGEERIGFHVIAAVADLEECDAWTQAMLESVALREES
jgi:hypothetical protein